MDDASAPQPLEEELLYHLNRFGAQAVFDGPVPFGMLRRLALYERVKNAYQARAKAGNFATWAKQYPTEAAILEQALLESL